MPLSAGNAVILPFISNERTHRLEIARWMAQISEKFSSSALEASSLSISGNAVIAGNLQVGGTLSASAFVITSASFNRISGSALEVQRISASSGAVTGTLSVSTLAATVASFNRASTSALEVSGAITASGAVTLLTTLSVSGTAVFKSPTTFSGTAEFAAVGINLIKISSQGVIAGIRFGVSSGLADSNFWDLRTGGVGRSFALLALDDGFSATSVLSFSRSGTGVITTFIGGEEVSISGAVKLASTLSVSGAATLKSSLNVEGTTSLSGAVALGTTLSVSGATVLKDTLNVSGTATLARIIGTSGNITGSFTVDTDLVVGAKTTTGTLSVSGTVVAANVAKAWVRFVAADPPVINSSFNVASVSRSATAIYRVTYTNAMADNLYAFNFTHTGLRLPNAISAIATSIKWTLSLPGGTAADGVTSCVFIYR